MPTTERRQGPSGTAPKAFVPALTVECVVYSRGLVQIYLVVILTVSSQQELLRRPEVGANPAIRYALLLTMS